MKFFTCILGICFSITAISQNYDFGKISKEELQEAFNPLDSSASATYLYKKRRTYFEYDQIRGGFMLITEIHERVKLYNQEGFDYGTKAVSLYKNRSDDEQLIGLKAYTYNLEGGKIEKTKLDKRGIFKTELSKYRNETKFTMPNLKSGTIVEYKYKISSPFFWQIDDFQFQYAIPVKKIDARLEAPEFYNFKLNTRGYLPVMPKKETKAGKITFTDKHRSGERITETQFVSSSLDFTIYITSYSLENIPALKNEPFVNNINNYRAAVKYELSHTKFPNQANKFFSTTWEDVVKTIYKNPSFGEELNKTGYFKNDIDALISGTSDPVGKAALIYSFVKEHVKWNGYISKYTDVGVRKAYKDHVGNSAEINLMLTAMLNYAGVKAYPVLVSTRNNGVPLFPTRDGYNYVVTYAAFDKGIMLFDATTKYGIPNVLPFRALNWQGRVIAEQGGSELVDLYPKQKSKTTITMFVNLNEAGDLEGNIRTIKSGHLAMRYRDNYLETDRDQFLEKLENTHGGMEISEFNVKNDKVLTKPIMETCKFSLESQADIIGDKIYFAPLFFESTKENPFKLEKREFPVDFGYPMSTKYMVTVNIPEGYKVESVPEAVAYTLPDNLGRFRYHVENNGNTISAMVETEINAAIVSPVYYEGLKDYFSAIVDKEGEQIVLTKE